MLVQIGDIVKRRVSDERLNDCSRIFLYGYFIVIDVFEPKITHQNLAVCKLMNTAGDLSWILQADLDIIIRLQGKNDK